MIETNEFRSAGHGSTNSNDSGVSPLYDEARTVPVRTTNRKLNLRAVAQVLEEAGFDPIEKILETMPQLDANMTVKTCLSLAEFVFPKKKAVEHHGTDGGPVQHSMKVEFV